MSTADHLASAAPGSAAAVVSRFNAALAAHDLAAAMTLISDDCVFESTSPPDGERCTGHEAIATALKPIFDDPDSRFTIEQTIEAGSRIVQLWRYDWAGGHVRGAEVTTVDAGKITEMFAYVKG